MIMSGAPLQRIQSSSPIEDSRVIAYEPLIQPELLKTEIVASPTSKATVSAARREAAAIIEGSDPRVLVVVGPCSIHDPAQAMEYAKRLVALAAELDGLFLVMRTYLFVDIFDMRNQDIVADLPLVSGKETANDSRDPEIDGSFKINKGLRLARQLLCDITDLGLPVGAELLDTISPQYFADLISWGAIGARTTESQLHRELASGSSFPIGFKNGTEGSIQVAVDAMGAASHAHTFLGVTEHGLAAIVKTAGNPHGHVILRGGSSGPNYGAEHVKKARDGLIKAGKAPSVMIDCSHANSQKDYRNQSKVLADICSQLESGDHTITGVMIESNINEGKQDAPTDGPSKLKYGVSITDGCVNWDTTVTLLTNLNKAALARQKSADTE
ncbi:hypothetical protein FRB96_005564 [Tulasnella sp. 330]|nr:hypothetical protein FRB96_005564 [Tulasnella sp. 330]